MIRFSNRLKRKREVESGQKELLLPHAKRIEGSFEIAVSCYMTEWHGPDQVYDYLQEVKFSARSDSSIGWVLSKVIEILGLSGVDRVKVELYHRRKRLDPTHLVGNCNIGADSVLHAAFEPSEDIGREFYLDGEYKAAVAHLRYALTNDLCYNGHYAIYYGDICLRSLDGRHRALEHAAKWYLEAIRLCDETVFSALKALSPEFAAKLRIAKEARDYPLDELIDDLVAEWSKIDVQKWAVELSKKIK